MPGRTGVGSQASEAAEPVLNPRCTATHEADGGRQQGQGRAGQDKDAVAPLASSLRGRELGWFRTAARDWRGRAGLCMRPV